MTGLPEPGLSPDPDPEEEPKLKEDPKPEEPRPQEVKAARKLSPKEMVAEVARVFQSEWDLHVPSVAEIGEWRSEWAAVRGSRVKMAEEFSSAYKERKESGVKGERELSEKAKERTSQVLAERKRSAPVPAGCIVCKKPVRDSEEVVRGTDGHVVHSSVCQLENECAGCLEGTAADIPAGISRDLMMIVGHGYDSEENTFVPAGMTVHAFAAPGVGLPFEDGALALMNPRAAAKAMTFEPESSIPNMEVEELSAAQAAAMRNVFRHAGGREGDVDWVSDSRLLCTAEDERLCKPPFHACQGLLQTYRGTKELYLVACAGEAMPDEYSAETQGYDKLMRLIMDKGKENPAKALSFYNGLNKVLQAVLQLDPDFVAWYDKTLRQPLS